MPATAGCPASFAPSAGQDGRRNLVPPRPMVGFTEARRASAISSPSPGVKRPFPRGRNAPTAGIPSRKNPADGPSHSIPCRREHPTDGTEPGGNTVNRAKRTQLGRDPTSRQGATDGPCGCGVGVPAPPAGATPAGPQSGAPRASPPSGPPCLASPVRRDVHGAPTATCCGPVGRKAGRLPAIPRWEPAARRRGVTDSYQRISFSWHGRSWADVPGATLSLPRTAPPACGFRLQPGGRIFPEPDGTLGEGGG